MWTVINSLAPLCVCLAQTHRWPTTSAAFHRLNSLIRCLFIQQRRSSGMRTSSQQNTTQAKVGVNVDSSPCLRDLMCTRAFKTVSVLSLVMLTLVRNWSDCLRQSSYVWKGRPQQRSDYWQLAHRFSNSHSWRSYSAKPHPQLFTSPPFSSVFSGCLALAKLNLQFLTLHDYLLRNFNLFRLESTYEIRQDIEDVVFRMKPWWDMTPHLHSKSCLLFFLFILLKFKCLCVTVCCCPWSL